MDYTITEVWGAVTLSPCPFCEAETRHAKRGDPRGPISILPNGYHCHACNRGGSRAELEGLKLSTKQEAAVALSSRELPDPVRVAHFWNMCLPITTDTPEHAYLCERFKKGFVETPPSIVRRLPEYALETQEIKGWKHSKRTLLFPLWDSTGTLRSVVGRSIAKKPRIKSLSFTGFGRSGLFLADELAFDATVPLVVAEGEMDFLAWSLEVEKPHGTVGIFSGSLTDNDFFATLRYRDVLLATDLDEAGDTYAAKILAALGKTNRVIRWQSQTR